jgi:hypothetical protein
MCSGDQQVHCPARTPKALSCLLHGRALETRERVSGRKARHVLAPGDPWILLAELRRIAGEIASTARARKVRGSAHTNTRARTRMTTALVLAPRKEQQPSDNAELSQMN